MKIAIGVHGRFHSFDLARALLERGHEVTVFTNYPKWATERFGLPAKCVKSFWQHGVATRAATSVQNAGIFSFPEEWFHPLFGRWLAAELARSGPWDIIHAWSGVAEEELVRRTSSRPSTIHLVMRGSAHIRTQSELLTEEERRTAARQDRPSRWMIAREEREYLLADRIVVLSTFAYRTFAARGIDPARLALLPLGARLATFRPSEEAIEARRLRILSRLPLRVLFVGTLSYRKGMWDLAEAIRALGPERFTFRLVGACLPEAADLIAGLPGNVQLTPRQAQASLPAMYDWGDVFVFPTIEDGYAVVLAQAAAAGLPIVATTNCSAPDLVQEGESGWVVPIRSPQSLIERLRWCDEHRPELADMVTNIYEHLQPRNWNDVAADFERICAA